MDVTIKLLENATHATLQSKSGSGLVDGFPHKMDQAL
jgi:hypothetical protein